MLVTKLRTMARIVHHCQTSLTCLLHDTMIAPPAYLRVNLDKADLVYELLVIVVEEVGEQPDCLNLLAGVRISVTNASIAASTSCLSVYIVSCDKDRNMYE